MSEPQHRTFGPQFVRVYHASHSAEPPHLAELPEANISIDTNTDEDVIHAGTAMATDEIGISNRPFVHIYDIPFKKIHPDVHGDSSEQLENALKRKTLHRVLSEKGITPGESEETPADPWDARELGMAIGYRNMNEDIGSVSYMLPKSEINGTQRYVRGYVMPTTPPEELIRYRGMIERPKTRPVNDHGIDR